jgi:hypothetical protein
MRLETARIVGLTGPPGIGKSRLAAEVAARWSGPTVRVDLTGLRGLDEVLGRVSGALSLEHPGSIVRVLGSHPGLLLILDEATTAVQAATEAALEWREGVPSLHVLLVSRIRAPRHVEWLTVEPLDSEAARALFTDRLESGILGSPPPLPEPEVAGLIQHVDGVPLAIELAASLARMYAPHEWSALVASVHRTDPISAALQLSWELLDAEQRASLTAMCHFCGAFDATSHAEVSGRPLEILQALLASSLVTMWGYGVFCILQPIRSYVRDHADPLEWSRSHEAYVRCVLRRGREAWSAARRGGGWGGLAQFRSDLEAIRWTVGGEPAVEAVRLLGELSLHRGPLLDPTEGFVPPAEAAAELAALRSRILRARLDLDGALAACEVVPRTHDEWTLLDSCRLDVYVDRRDYAEARALIQLRPFEAEAAPAVLVEWQFAWVGLLITSGELEEAQRRLTEMDVCGDAIWGAQRDAYLAVTRRQVDPEGASRLFERALSVLRTSGAGRWNGAIGGWYAVHLSESGDAQGALSAMQAAAAASWEAGDHVSYARSALYQCELLLEAGRVDDCEALLLEVLGLALPARSALRATSDAVTGMIALARADRRAAVPWRQGASERFALLGFPRAADVQRAVLAVAQGEVGEISNPELRELAARLIAGAEVGHVRGRAARLLCSLARQALRIERAQVVASDGGWFRVGALTTSLQDKPVLRRLVGALASGEPSSPKTRTALLDSVWPDDRAARSSLEARLYVAIRALRKAGLAIETTRLEGEVAYCLAAGITVETESLVTS